jgi:hypothetical protein
MASQFVSKSIDRQHGLHDAHTAILMRTVLAADTNVLVYAAAADSQFQTGCRDWLGRSSMSLCA